MSDHVVPHANLEPVQGDSHGAGGETIISGSKNEVLFQTTIGMGMERKLVSYKDVCLGVNGHNQSKDDVELFAEGLPDHIEGVSGGVVGDSSPFLGDPLCPVVRLSEEERKAIQIPWKRALLVKLLGKRMGLKYFHAHLIKLWRPRARLEVIDLDNEYFVIRFEDYDDLVHMLEDGSWMLADHYIVIQTWQPSFSPLTDDLRRVAVCIRVPNLPIEFYDRRVLWRIGNVLGKTVKIDANTLRESDGRVYPVEYEGLHLVCFKCGRYGHKKEACPLLFKENEEKDKEVPQMDSTVTSSAATVTQEEDSSFGPWMMAHKPQRRNFRNSGVVSGKKNGDVIPEGQRGSSSNVAPKSGGNKGKQGSRFNVLYSEDNVIADISKVTDGNSAPTQVPRSQERYKVQKNKKQAAVNKEDDVIADISKVTDGNSAPTQVPRSQERYKVQKNKKQAAVNKGGESKETLGLPKVVPSGQGVSELSTQEREFLHHESCSLNVASGIKTRSTRVGASKDQDGVSGLSLAGPSKKGRSHMGLNLKSQVRFKNIKQAARRGSDGPTIPLTFLNSPLTGPMIITPSSDPPDSVCDQSGNMDSVEIFNHRSPDEVSIHVQHVTDSTDYLLEDENVMHVVGSLEGNNDQPRSS
ncbi:Zinc finger, CCHC-type [Sesbania bispinosa]|nr:Zinc finger, CCHC-type [Sesbania bispinosa]